MTEGATQHQTRSDPGRVHVAVVGAFVVAAIAALTKIPHDLEAAKPNPVSAAERAVAPATSYGLDARLAVAAAREIPPGATYAVVGGGHVSARFVSEETTLLAYWLLPRRRTDARSSDWIISIGGDLRSLGLRYARVVRVGRDRELASVLR